MADQFAYFVQFPHPGDEHNSRTDYMPWNTGKHQRKFLIAPGRYIDGNRHVGEAELVFWGEWEPPSRVVRRWPGSDHLPQLLHQPYWAKPTKNTLRQNTDPWVFGDRMIYSNCKQVTGRPARKPKSMQGLTRGSVICFGSPKSGGFWVDTVFVVASRKRWVPAEKADLSAGDAFEICTAASLRTDVDSAHLSLTLYCGATVDDPVAGMFSFVPARRAGADGPRFPRPTLRLNGLINPASLQATWGSRRRMPIDDVRCAWETVRKQVIDAGLVLAVQLQTPPLDTGNVVIPKSSRQRC